MIYGRVVGSGFLFPLLSLLVRSDCCFSFWVEAGGSILNPRGRLGPGWERRKAGIMEPEAWAMREG